MNGIGCCAAAHWKIKSQISFASQKSHLHVEGPGVNHPREDRGLVRGEGEAEGREEERGVGRKRVVGFSRCRGEAGGETVWVGRHEDFSTPILLLVTMSLRLALVILNLHRRGVTDQLEEKC